MPWFSNPSGWSTRLWIFWLTLKIQHFILKTFKLSKILFNISFCEPNVMTYNYIFYPMTISIICTEYTVILFFRIDEIWKKIKSYFNTAACYSTFSPSRGYKQSNWKSPSVHACCYKCRCTLCIWLVQVKY